jgi:CubicO group peptidase (beta-lactamase class C family)
MRRLILLLLLAGVSAWGQEYDFTPLDRYLERAARQLPSGFEVAINQNGRQIYWKTFGPWPKDNQAKIASATKWFSGAVIMSLVDDGILSLDDRASKYLPYMTGEKAEITIRQLMAHTAGFPGEFPLADPCLGDSSDTLDHCAQALARVPLQAPPGTAFIYAGADMQIAGRVAEVASGKDWNTLFRERIAEPLEMTSTDYEYDGPTRNPRISGGARSTVSDYMKFLTMIRQRGIYNGRRVLSTRAIDVMLSDQTGGVPIVESPFQRLPGARNRYGIGNWVENPDEFGQTMENSSIGLAGWTPLIDASRNLQVVVGMQNALRPFQPFYPGLKEVLKALIPEAALTPSGVTNAASYEAGPVAPYELVAVFGRNLGPEEAVSGVGTDSLAGTRVTFDGAPAPVLYTSERQVIAIAPASITGKSSVQVAVQYNGAAPRR